MPELVDQKTVFSLLEVTRSIQKTISGRYGSLYWIKAEMNKLNHYTHSGHCYPELVEKKDGKIVAEIRSVLWKMDYQRINKQFLELLGEPLREGITILFQAGISYDPLYGLSLKIVDIDPSFALGELEREKKESIEKLKKEGLFDANKRLSFPTIPKRIAIISVETSKGLSDFFKIIRNNPWGYRFDCTLYPALLQGDKSVPSIIKQLAVIAERTESYDVSAIIRGGGGEVGLSSYNNYLLAKAIAAFPIPVLTGIGHSTNETVSEMVAHKNAITPSELADFLVRKFHDFAVPVSEAQHRIIAAGRTVFLRENRHLQALAQSLSWNGKAVFSQERNAIATAGQRLERSAHHFLKDRSAELIHGIRRVQLEAFRFLKERRAELAHIGQLVQLASPEQWLKKGFSITRANGKAIADLAEVQEGDLIETEMHGGKISSRIISKEATS